MIATAVNELCKSTPFSSLTVDPICENAEVSRSTFYKAFSDKYDICAWYQDLMLKGGMGEVGRTLTCRQGIRATFEGFNCLKYLFNAMKDHPEATLRTEKARIEHVQLFRETLEQYHGIEMNDELLFLIEWNVIAYLRMSMDWMMGYRVEDMDSMVNLIASSFSPELLVAFDKPTNPIKDPVPLIQRVMLTGSREQSLKDASPDR